MKVAVAAGVRGVPVTVGVAVLGVPVTVAVLADEPALAVATPVETAVAVRLGAPLAAGVRVPTAIARVATGVGVLKAWADKAKFGSGVAAPRPEACVATGSACSDSTALLPPFSAVAVISDAEIGTPQAAMTRGKINPAQGARPTRRFTAAGPVAAKASPNCRET